MLVDPGPVDLNDSDASVRISFAIVALAARMVPIADRRGWHAEWHAELLAHNAMLRSRRSRNTWTWLRLIWHALGSFSDAWQLSAHGFGPANLVRDLGLACRSLAKRPGFLATAVITLALGIGANTALFSVVRGVLLRPFPYEDPERLVQLLGHREGETPGSGNVSYPNLHDFDQVSATLTGVVGMAGWRPALTGDQPQVLPGATVSWDYFHVLGVRAAAGRFFEAEEEGEGRVRAVVISHGVWTRQFAQDRDLIGRQINVDNESYTLLGVAPEGFEGPHLISFEGEQPVIWRTPWFEATDTFRSGRSWKGLARLAPGVGIEQAQTEVSVIMGRLIEQYPEENTDRQVTLSPLRDSVVSDSRSALLLLLGAVVLVLLVACVNVANLLLGRMLERQDELLVRGALGAGRGHLLTLLFAEGLAIAAIGGALGVLLAYASVGALVGIAGMWLPRPEGVGVDGTVLAFSLALTLGTSVVFGLLPALRVTRDTRLSAVSGVRMAGARSALGAGLRRTLVLVQVAASVVLVIGAGLLLRSFWNLQRVDLGVGSQGVMTVTMHGASWWDLEPEAATVGYRELLDRITALPMVNAAGAIDVVPLADNHSCDGFIPIDRPPPGPGEGECAEVRSLTPGALEALGVHLLSGRTIDWSDRSDAAGAMVLSREAAQHFWPDQEALGKAALVHSDTFSVVGVVADIRHFGPAEAATPLVFLSAQQEPWNGITRGLTLVMSGPPAIERAGQEIARAIQDVKPAAALEAIRPMRTLLANTTGGSRFRAALLLAFAGLALLLALVGIVGVISQSVTRRQRELGIRIALGAAPGRAVRAVLGEGVRITLAGLAIGLLASLAMTRLLQSFMFGVSPLDPTILAGGCVLVFGLAVLASWLPARRAGRIDPVQALRGE